MGKKRCNGKSNRLDRGKKLDHDKQRLANFLELGGKWSNLELLIIAAARFNFTVDGSQHVNSQLRRAIQLMDNIDKPKRNRVRTKKEFYSSRAWKILRYQAFEKYGNKCQCCGATPGDGLTMHVDHIKPRSTNPELALDLNNLQILCIDCNVGKINQWDTDWRP